jgi:hypothetical protein
VAKKQWSDLSDRQRTVLVIGGAVEVVLTTAALVDLARRPRDEVNGSKALWAIACFVQPVGPIAYWASRLNARGPAPRAPRVTPMG